MNKTEYFELIADRQKQNTVYLGPDEVKNIGRYIAALEFENQRLSADIQINKELLETFYQHVGRLETENKILMIRYLKLRAKLLPASSVSETSHT